MLVGNDNATHEHPKVKVSREGYPRSHFILLPKLATWLSLVKDAFSELTNQLLRRLASTAQVNWMMQFMAWSELGAVLAGTSTYLIVK